MNRLLHNLDDTSQRIVQPPQHPHEQTQHHEEEEEEEEQCAKFYKYLHLDQQHNSHLIEDDTHDHDRTLQDEFDDGHVNDGGQQQQQQQQESEELMEGHQEEEEDTSSTHHFSILDEFSPSLKDANDDGISATSDIIKHSSRATTNSISLTKTRASIIDSIEWLGRHVPCCVLSQISHEVLYYKKGNPMEHNFRMPYAVPYEAALLFVDMSGFTKLSQSLDVESLSKVSWEC
jgi:hypothetical protein